MHLYAVRLNIAASDYPIRREVRANLKDAGCVPSDIGCSASDRQSFYPSLHGIFAWDQATTVRDEKKLVCAESCDNDLVTNDTTLINQ